MAAMRYPESCAHAGVPSFREADISKNHGRL